MTTIFIVGNKFHGFSCNHGVITIGELREMARTHTFDRLAPGSRVAAGQGVREAELQDVYDHARCALAARGIDLGPALRRDARASRLQTHKHRIHNSIISHPARLDDRRFEAQLLLDERSELMADHQTGQHIQGMILVEAARQLFLAVTEEYFIGHDVPDRYYFVINTMDVRFKAFVFPIGATLRYDVLSQDTENPARLRFDIVVSVIQGGVCATEVAIGFTAFHASRIEAKEQQQATNLLDRIRQLPNAEHVISGSTAASKPSKPHLEVA